MDDSGIWALVIIFSVVILIVTFLTSVTVLHKKFVEKPLEKMEEKANEDLVNKDEINKDISNK
jgi:regulatory protein YycI of two-component signal transduction system YycFG